MKDIRSSAREIVEFLIKKNMSSMRIEFVKLLKDIFIKNENIAAIKFSTVKLNDSFLMDLNFSIFFDNGVKFNSVGNIYLSLSSGVHVIPEDDELYINEVHRSNIENTGLRESIRDLVELKECLWSILKNKSYTQHNFGGSLNSFPDVKITREDCFS